MYIVAHVHVDGTTGSVPIRGVFKLDFLNRAVPLYNVHTCIYRKSGNFRCKHIFVVNGGYEN